MVLFHVNCAWLTKTLGLVTLPFGEEPTLCMYFYNVPITSGIRVLIKDVSIQTIYDFFSFPSS